MSSESPVSIGNDVRFAGFFLYFDFAQHRFNCFPFFTAAAKKETPRPAAPTVPQKTHTPLKKCSIGDFFGVYLIKKEFDREGASEANGIEGVKLYCFASSMGQKLIHYNYDPIEEYSISIASVIPLGHIAAPFSGKENIQAGS